MQRSTSGAGTAPDPSPSCAPTDPAKATCITVRAATVRDTAATSRIHIQRLRLGLFPQLGPGFVHRWHATYVSSPFGIALVAETPSADGPLIVGYLIGSSDEAAHVAHVLRHDRIALLCTGVTALARRPRVAAGFVRTRGRHYVYRVFLQRRRRRSTSSTQARAEQVGVLTALAVDPRYRSLAAGRRLTTRYLELAHAGGADSAQLVTEQGTLGAAAFYERLGWRRVGSKTSIDGNPLVTLTYPLSERGTPT